MAGEGENEVGVISAIKNEKLQILNEELKEKNQSNSNLEFRIDNLALNDVVVRVNPRYYRPTEVELLIGNPTKAKEKIGWEAKTVFEELVKIMTKADFEKTNN